jgi:hypothetical protein
LESVHAGGASVLISKPTPEIFDLTDRKLIALSQ